MPRGTFLSMEERGAIVKKIAEQLRRSRSPVAGYLRNPATYGLNKKGGQHRTLTNREERRIWHKASNSTLSLRQIRADLELNVSRTTIWRAIRRSGYIRRAVMRKAPRLTPLHKLRRLQFARENMRRDWEKVGIIKNADIRAF
ncbi:unnamed protein product [Cylicostephanus goldi]|uniref:Transposase Tc1-like domain-containing protein n=1 Tax=Cylicostephanus goldi TaxID=71465 RepID=A0A3P7QKJ8_CYLGO|nr:unnamed protein product [Cylicostephanus goldi]